MKLSKKQLTDVVDNLFCGAAMNMEQYHPECRGRDYSDKDKAFTQGIDELSTFCWLLSAQLSILYARQTDDGMGTGDAYESFVDKWEDAGFNYLQKAWYTDSGRKEACKWPDHSKHVQKFVKMVEDQRET